MKMKLYQIETGNRFNDKLIFTSKKTAENWLKKATTNPQQHEIKEITRAWQGFFIIS